MKKKVKLIPDVKSTKEMKQAFLSSAITDISTYIQLADTKVSIIMGALVALVAGVLACYDPISQAFLKIKPCSGVGVVIIVFSLLHLFSIILVFVFGILTIRGHVSEIGYESRWFLPQSTKVYSFDAYKNDINLMTDKAIIENMAAELYKLNDINRQKAKTMKWVMRSFAFVLITGAVVGCLLLLSAS